MIEDEELFAWLDGELDGEAADRVAARVKASPELSQKAEQHRQLASGLRDAFTPIVEAGVAPPEFESAEVIDFGARTAGRSHRRGWFAAPQWAAMAASLAVGLFAGAQFLGGDKSPVAIDGNRLVAAAALQQALETRLASAPSEGVRIGLTFRDAGGRVCRSFSDGPASGLACRDGGQWRIRGLFQAPEGQAGDYRMAAGEDPRLAALIDDNISGEPFDAVQEEQARQRKWR